MRAQFVLSEIGVGLRRNLTMTFAVIVSVALSLALFGGSLLMSDQVGAMKGYWYDKVVHESQDEAYKHYKEQFGDSPLAASLTPDQMQESYRIKLKDPEKYQVIATAFNGRDGVQSVQDQKGILDNLFTMLNLMNRAALGVMALMLIVALL